MNTTLFINTDRSAPKLADVALNVFQALGLSEWEERFSSNYPNGHYFAGYSENARVAVFDNDLEMSADYPYHITVKEPHWRSGTGIITTDPPKIAELLACNGFNVFVPDGAWYRDGWDGNGKFWIAHPPGKDTALRVRTDQAKQSAKKQVKARLRGEMWDDLRAGLARLFPFQKRIKDQNEAKKAAERYLRQKPADLGELMIKDEETIHKSYGWIFFYNSKEFLVNGDYGKSLLGNGPLVVLALSGRVIPLRSSFEPAKTILRFERRWKNLSHILLTAYIFTVIVLILMVSFVIFWIL